MKEIITTGEDTIQRIIEREYGETDPEKVKALIELITRENQVGSLVSLMVGQMLRLPDLPSSEKKSDEPVKKTNDTGGKSNAKDS